METRVGLPNTCSKCGKDPGGSWFAPNEDVAQAGGGLCASCAGQKQQLPAVEPTNEIPGDMLAAARDLRDQLDRRGIREQVEKVIDDERILRSEGAARAESEAQTADRPDPAAEDRQEGAVVRRRADSDPAKRASDLLLKKEKR